ncbi:MAG: hypothetical protein KDB07_07095, partial [Planctomycetes bacterium]|nr:hypothetical protein [Planctomycetota bacterium]
MIVAAALGLIALLSIVSMPVAAQDAAPENKEKPLVEWKWDDKALGCTFLEAEKELYHWVLSFEGTKLQNLPVDGIQEIGGKPRRIDNKGKEIALSMWELAKEAGLGKDSGDPDWKLLKESLDECPYATVNYDDVSCSTELRIRLWRAFLSDSMREFTEGNEYAKSAESFKRSGVYHIRNISWFKDSGVGKEQNPVEGRWVASSAASGSYFGLLAAHDRVRPGQEMSIGWDAYLGPVFAR